jgi:hypothetical protein
LTPFFGTLLFLHGNLIAFVILRILDNIRASHHHLQAQMLLNQLPPELFEALSQFWDGRHIIKLLLTGDMATRQLMAGPRGVRNFRWKGRPVLQDIPHILSVLANLRTFSVKSFSRRQDNSICDLLPASVETIDMQIPNSICHFFKEPPKYSDTIFSFQFPTPIGYIFPNLHTLSVCDARQVYGAILLQNLPDSLMNVSIHYPDAPSFESAKDVFPTKLPASLESLHIDGFYELGEEHTIWPKNLTSLRLPQCRWTLRPDRFPSTLTELDMPLNFHTDYLTEEEEIEWKKRFFHMKSLTFRSGRPYSYLIMLAEEGTLEHLEFYNAMQLHELDYVPKTVKSLVVVFRKGLDASLYQRLPRSLIKFKMSHLDDDAWWINKPQLAKLPPTLETFEVVNCEVLKSEFVGYLPKSLTFCPMLNSAVLSTASLPLLPRGLKELTIEKRSTRLPFENYDMTSLPPALEHLRFEAVEVQITDAGLRELPRGLKTLVHLTNTSFTNLGLSLLPSNLTILHLPKNASISNAGIARLPPNLTELMLEGDEMILSTKCFKNLPPRLRGLSIKKIGCMSDAALAQLPSSITSLILPGNSSISDKCFKFLPRQVRRLVLRKNISLTPVCLKFIRSDLEFLNIKENPNFEKRAKLTKKMPKTLTLVSKNGFWKSIAYEDRDELLSNQL